MVEIMMTPIAQSDVGERNVVNTGISTVGRGGHDYYCGHCGKKMMQNINVSRFDPMPVFQCGSCQSYNEAPIIDDDADDDTGTGAQTPA